MLKMILVSFKLSLQNIKANFLHTVLSVLGIVIGVAALVAILSFIDGMEKFAKDQISSTTSLNSIVVQTNRSKTVDGVRMQKQEWGYFTYEQLQQLKQSLKRPATAYIFVHQPQEVLLPDSGKTVGIMLSGVVAEVAPKVELLAGRLFTPAEVDGRQAVVLVSDLLAKKMSGSEHYENVLGRSLQLHGQEMKVVGVVKGESEEVARAVIPITHFSGEELKANNPMVVLEASQVEDVTPLKQEVEAWLAVHLAVEEDDFSVATSEYRVEQITKGIMVFKIIMGMITGIAVLVGGIGIMNVLLISVTERTAEIGVRKAMGAKKRDILLQFLSESVTVSSLGSLLGLLLGIAVTLIAVPIIQHFAEMPFEAAFTGTTIATVAVLAIVLGVVFGTYPAMRAARLDPVEAIRHE